MNHDLKCWPEPYSAIISGTKTHEIRECDRDFRVGDTLSLLEFEPCKRCQGRGRIHVSSWKIGSAICSACRGDKGRYTGRLAVVDVTYLTVGGNWNLPTETCVMSIRPKT